MKNKSKVKRLVRSAKEISDELFWEAASQARDPDIIFRITQLIDKAITEHEGNVRGKLPASNPVELGTGLRGGRGPTLA